MTRVLSLGVEAFWPSGQGVQMIAQNILTILVSRIVDILKPLKEAAPRQIQIATINPLGNSPDRPYPGLTNTYVQSIVGELVAAGIGSREDSLMSIIPALLQRSRLPDLDDVMEELLSHAKPLRRGGKFQVGEDLLSILVLRGSKLENGAIW
jgi:hypothetical protein